MLLRTRNTLSFDFYFSKIEYKAIKGWKQHKKMILNLIVPIEKVRFILYDDRKNHTNQLKRQLTTRLKNTKYKTKQF